MKEGLDTFLEGVGEYVLTAAAGGKAPSLRGVSSRVATAWQKDLLAGYRQNPATILAPLVNAEAGDLVAVRDITFTSICQHHLLPFSGVAHVAYLPEGKITGLSSLVRLVDSFSRRLQLQESLTQQIAGALQTHLGPAGAACLIEASHTCVSTRGTRRQGSVTVTAAWTGLYKKRPSRRQEVLKVLRAPSR